MKWLYHIVGVFLVGQQLELPYITQQFVPQLNSHKHCQTLILVTFIIINPQLESEFFRSFYFRGTFNTTYFDIGSLFYYIALMVIGFTYVVAVTLAFKRSSVLAGADGSYNDFKWILIYGVIFYFISGIVVLRQPKSLSSYCDQQSAN